jgi:hypothetical protein
VGDGEFGCPASFEDGLAAHLLDAHLPLASSGGLDDHLPWHQAYIRPEAVWEWQHSDARCHVDLAEVCWEDVIM